MLGVDEGADAPAALRLRHHVVDERRLSRGLGSVDLDDPTARKAADAEREVERERAGGDGADRDLWAVAHAHHGSLAELPLDLAERDIQRLLTIHRHPPPSGRLSRISYRAPDGCRRERKAAAAD